MPGHRRLRALPPRLHVARAGGLCRPGDRGGRASQGDARGRIPSSELERYLEREPTEDPTAALLSKRVEAFREANGKDPGPFVDAWRSGKIEDTPENAEVALEALALRTALARQRVAAA